MNIRDRARKAAESLRLTEVQEIAFIRGAEWAHSQRPTVEQIARVMWEHDNGLLPYDELPREDQEDWLRRADAVLTLMEGEQ